MTAKYAWNNTTSSWGLNYARSYVFNHGKQYLTEQYQGPANGDKWYYGFDISGRVVADTAARYDDHRQIWFYNALNTSQYDAKGNLIYKLFYAFDTSSNLFYVTLFDSSIYDNHNYLVEDYLGTKVLNTEYINTRDVYTNDTNGNTLLEIEYIWDSTNHSWGNNNRIESIYDSKGNQLLYVTYSWNNTTQSWQGTNKNSIRYDNMNNWTMMLFQYWDSTGWVNNEYDTIQSEYIGGRLIQSAENGFRWYQGHWIPFLTSIYKYDEYGNELFYQLQNGLSDSILASGARYYYYYEALDISNNNSIAPSPLIIYPDPSSQTLTIALSQTYLNEPYSVYDLMGQRMTAGYLSGNNYFIDVSGYAEGIYVLKVNSLTQKFIVKR